MDSEFYLVTESQAHVSRKPPSKAISVKIKIFIGLSNCSIGKPQALQAQRRSSNSIHHQMQHERISNPTLNVLMEGVLLVTSIILVRKRRKEPTRPIL